MFFRKHTCGIQVVILGKTNSRFRKSFFFRQTESVRIVLKGRAYNDGVINKKQIFPLEADLMLKVFLEKVKSKKQS